ncbi:MAG: tetratricopeptide repeat protein [Magnetococcales bacterium]|nr:tetratricopeptide repeat protein [Magnetococcales bacterium]
MNRAERRRQEKLSRKSAQPSLNNNQSITAAQEALQKAIAYHQSGQIDQAMYWYNETLNAQPTNTTALGNLGSILQNQGKLDEAILYHRKTISIKPDLATAHSNLGVAVQEQGKLDEAVACFQKAISIKPDFAEAHNNLGFAQIEIGKLDEAVSSCKKAVTLKPDYADAYSNLGYALLEQKKLEEAVSSCKMAIAIRPDFADAHTNLSSALREQGKADEAIYTLENALKSSSNYNKISEALIDILNFYTPENEYLGVHVKTQQTLQKKMASSIEKNSPTNEIIKQLFQGSYEVLKAQNLHNERYFHTQIFRGRMDDSIKNPIFGNCSRHKKVFDIHGVIPKHCFSCYKVTIKPRTVLELFKLMMVFHNLKLPNDNTRKCIVEVRPEVSGTYKGFIFCQSFEEATDVLDIVKTLVCEKIHDNVPLTIKRGCSEYALAYPDYEKTEEMGSPLMMYNEEWRKYEEEVDKYTLGETNPMNNTFSHIGVTLRDAMVMRNWLAYAKMIEDHSFMDIFEHSVLALPIKKRPLFEKIAD